MFQVGATRIEEEEEAENFFGIVLERLRISTTNSVSRARNLVNCYPTM
jgi:hypothetical protein